MKNGKIRFVHSADLHLGTVFGGIDPRRAELLKKSLAAELDALIEYCVEFGADLLFLSGDIFDSPSPSAADIELLKNGIERLENTRVFLALGNHDFGIAGMECKNAHIFSSDKAEKIYIPELNANVYGQSFSSRFQETPLMEGIVAEEGKINFLCLHANLRGNDCNPVTARQLEKSGFDYAALGHIHSHSCERIGKTTVCYSGCLMGRGFDEIGEKGFVSGEIDRNAEISFIRSNAPRFEEIRVYASDYSDENEMISAIEERLDSRNLYRIIICGGELPLGYVEARLEKKAFYIEVRREAAAETDSPFMRILRDELKDKPRALEAAVKALTGRGGEL